MSGRLCPQGSAKELSPAALEKKRRRKQERDRKKRKRKELRAKEKARKAEEAAEAQEAVEPTPEGACTEPQEPPGLIFNKVSGSWGGLGRLQSSALPLVSFMTSLRTSSHL